MMAYLLVRIGVPALYMDTDIVVFAHLSHLTHFRLAMAPELAPDLVHPVLGALQQQLPAVAQQAIEKLP